MNLQDKINKVWNLAVYLQMMASFCKELDFDDYKKIMLDLHNTIKLNDGNEIKSKLVIYESKLTEISNPLVLKYPLKRTIDEIATDWNEKFKTDKEIFSNGIMIGWLEEQIDLINFYKYDYYPYHFKIGLVMHKNRGEIEEHFLLKDAFSCLIKAKNKLKLLDEYGQIQKDRFMEKGLSSFDSRTLDNLNIVKYEVALYSRIALVSFFSFLESFVNSIGFDYYYRYRKVLDRSVIEILNGHKKGRFLNIKTKIEKFQRIMRKDGIANIVLSDDSQIRDPFKTLFHEFEKLRNSSVHFTPEKTRIWLKPHDWVEKAEDLSKLTIHAALEIWKQCHETHKGPDYLGRLEYNRLYDMSNANEDKIKSIERMF